MKLPIVVWVGLGAGLGSLVRVLVPVFVPDTGGLPWSTQAANLGGSFAIGLYAARLQYSAGWMNRIAARHFFMAGFCGGLTTFSIFSLEVVELARSGAPFIALAWVGLSLAGWMLAVWAGWRLGSWSPVTK